MTLRSRSLFAFFCASAIALVPMGLYAQTATPPPAAGSGTKIVLPGGTTVSIIVVNKISSATAQVGDTFAIQANEDVVVDGFVAIAKGAPGQGEILSVDRAGSHGHAGSLGVQFDWIYAADGNKVKLTNQRSTEEGQGEAGKSSTLTVLSYAFLGLPGLFAHNFVKGHDVEVDSSHPLKAYVDSSVYVVATTKSNAEPGFAPAVGGSVAAASTPAAGATTTSAAGMAAAAPDTYAPAADATSLAPGDGNASSTVFELSGSGNQTTKAFSVGSTWAIAWSYDCGTEPKSAQTFAVKIQGGTAQAAIEPTGASGIDITHFNAPGTYSLAIQSGCTWHIRVMNG